MTNRKTICTNCGAVFSTKMWDIDKSILKCCPKCKNEFEINEYEWRK